MATVQLSRRPRRVTRAIACIASMSAVSCGSIGLLATPASAGLLSTVAGVLPNCGARAASAPFAPWGDTHSYFLMPGGNFESAAAGWTTSGGAKVVSGNETSFVNAESDSHSLSIPSGAQATSPTVCVAMGENSVRLFVKNSGIASSVLHVQAYVQNPLTGLVLSTGLDVNGTTGENGWAPTDRLLIPNLLGGVLGTQNVTLVFTTRGPAATWNIDDVFVDPFRSR